MSLAVSPQNTKWPRDGAENPIHIGRAVAIEDPGTGLPVWVVIGVWMLSWRRRPGPHMRIMRVKGDRHLSLAGWNLHMENKRFPGEMPLPIAAGGVR